MNLVAKRHVLGHTTKRTNEELWADSPVSESKASREGRKDPCSEGGMPTWPRVHLQARATDQATRDLLVTLANTLNRLWLLS